MHSSQFKITFLVVVELGLYWLFCIQMFLLSLDLFNHPHFPFSSSLPHVFSDFTFIPLYLYTKKRVLYAPAKTLDSFGSLPHETPRRRTIRREDRSTASLSLTGLLLWQSQFIEACELENKSRRSFISLEWLPPKWLFPLCCFIFYIFPVGQEVKKWI